MDDARKLPVRLAIVALLLLFLPLMRGCESVDVGFPFTAAVIDNEPLRDNDTLANESQAFYPLVFVLNFAILATIVIAVTFAFRTSERLPKVLDGLRHCTYYLIFVHVCTWPPFTGISFGNTPALLYLYSLTGALYFAWSVRMFSMGLAFIIIAAAVFSIGYATATPLRKKIYLAVVIGLPALAAAAHLTYLLYFAKI